MSEIRSVAMLCPGWPPVAVPNGIVAYTGTMRDALLAEGIEFQVLVPRVSGPPEPGVTAVLGNSLPARARRAVRRRLGALRGRRASEHEIFMQELARNVRRLHRRARVGVLEMEESFGFPAVVAPRVDVPVVVRLHGPWFLNGPALGESGGPAFDARVAREREGILAGAVTAPCQDVLDQTRAYYGLPLPDARVIPNPATPAPESHLWAASRADPNTIVFIGRFDRHKGGDLVLDAFSLLAPRFPELRLEFIGPDRGLALGDGQTIGIEDYLKRFTPDVRGRIGWAGQQPQSRLPAIRQRAAVVVIPSRYENFAYSVLESMSQGCPMVAARTGGIPELIQDGRNGLLFKAADVANLADRVAELLNDRPRAAALGAQARSDALARYDPRLIAQQTLEFYRGLR